LEHETACNVDRIESSVLIGRVGNTTFDNKTFTNCVLVGDGCGQTDRVGYLIRSNTTDSTMVGVAAGQYFDGSSDLSLFGYRAGQAVSLADRSVAFGSYAMLEGRGTDNAAFGYSALRSYVAHGTGDRRELTALGASALKVYRQDLVNATAVGYNAQVTGSHQLQLGDSRTTVYSHTPIQNRCDRRDKTDITPTRLGLTFINQLKPVEHRYDFREDYIDYSTRPLPPTYIRPEPIMPDIAPSHPDYQSTLLTFNQDRQDWNNEKRVYDEAIEIYTIESSRWDRDNSLVVIIKDGSKKRTRLHQSFLADEVKQTADAMDVEFGGYQDHSVNGGADVKTLGMVEFIPPIVKAVQELDSKLEHRTAFLEFANQAAFVDAVAQRVLELMQRSNT
jgi:hypothetical protein